MSETSEDNKDKGFRLNSHGLSCIPCRCKRQFYHEETKTVNANDKITTNTIADKRNTKFGSTGRHTSPDDIFKQDSNLQAGSVEICSTGWDDKQQRITPEEVEEQVDVLRTDVKEIKEDVEKLKKII